MDRFDIDGFVADCITAREEDAPELAIREVVRRALEARTALEASSGVPDTAYSGRQRAAARHEAAADVRAERPRPDR